MLTASCHCVQVQVSVPGPPEELTDCNCSICRRLGVLWAYYNIEDVTIRGRPEHTSEYVWGNKTMRFVRCKHCGCLTHGEPMTAETDGQMGVNARLFEPGELGTVRIRKFDGAKTWQYLD